MKYFCSQWLSKMRQFVTFIVESIPLLNYYISSKIVATDHQDSFDRIFYFNLPLQNPAALWEDSPVSMLHCREQQIADKATGRRFRQTVSHSSSEVKLTSIIQSHSSDKRRYFLPNPSLKQGGDWCTTACESSLGASIQMKWKQYENILWRMEFPPTF